MKLRKHIVLVVTVIITAILLAGCGGSTCPSCGKSGRSLQTKKDWAGTTHSWCSECWGEYWDIINGN